jgi:superfamily I DNA/RNA helicase
MKRRVARLLESGVAPSRILPVTFTRVAAEDLHRELVGMGAAGCENLQGMTLHSLALRILTRNHVLEATGRTPRPLNDFEIKALEADMSAANGDIRKVRKLLKAYEAAWARLQRDEPGFEQSTEDEQFASNVVAWLIFHRAMLIGELIPQLHHYLFSNPAAGERNEYSHILVDEFQDLNKAEQGVIDLISENAEICIVGDDDQSIYSFKHAHPEGIRDWIATRPEADDLSLADCRRCPTSVVAMANALIAKNVNRPVPDRCFPFLTMDQETFV